MAPPARRLKDFRTERLAVSHWGTRLSDKSAREQLVGALTQILTPSVLEHLPPSLQTDQSADSVAAWIIDRAAESDVYCVDLAPTRTLVGLLFLGGAALPETQERVHVGYLLAQEAWGQGLATELIHGLVQTGHDHAPVSLIAGVARANTASAHLLRRQGFALQPDLSDADTQVYSLTLSAG